MLFIATKNYCSGESEGWNIHFCSVWSAYWATETGCVTVSCQILIMFLDSNIGTRILFFFKLHNDTQLFMVHLIKSTPSYIQSQKILNLKDSAVSISKHSFIQLYENTYSELCWPLIVHLFQCNYTLNGFRFIFWAIHEL